MKKGGVRMKQVQDTACVPQGFLAAGTYSGLCDKRVKLDLAALVSRTDCSIVISDKMECRQYTGKVFFLHNGTALPANARGQEIQEEVCQDIASHMHLPAADIIFAAQGMAGQFRPSRLADSLETLITSLAVDHGSQVGAVLDNNGDLTCCAMSAGTQSLLYGMAADGTAETNGLCVILTDADVTTAQLQYAVEQCRQTINTEEFTIISIANGAAQEYIPTNQLVKIVQDLCKQLGFQAFLQACS